MPSIVRLPWILQSRLEAAVAVMNPQRGLTVDFARPPGEEALVAADSTSWRVFKNPVSLFIGGVAAVILELAEPSVRTGVWEHSSFPRNPMGRLQRTGLAAMVTVYGARSVAEPMIARVVRMHAKVAGETPSGESYAASDARLLTWVHATAAFSFSEAYSRYVMPLSPGEFDALYRESVPASRLYGVLDTPESKAGVHALFASMTHRLEPSPIVFQFLQIMREAPAFPRPLLWMQRMLVRAAVDLIPDWVRTRLGLTEGFGLRSHEKWIVDMAAALSDRIVLSQGPAAQSCLRVGLPINHLYA
jgi:uncharacterized protein (DUF2236 family)